MSIHIYVWFRFPSLVGSMACRRQGLVPPLPQTYEEAAALFSGASRFSKHFVGAVTESANEASFFYIVSIFARFCELRF